MYMHFYGHIGDKQKPRAGRQSPYHCKRLQHSFIYNNFVHCVWACPEIYVVCHIINVHSLLEVILEGVSISRTRA